MPVTPLDPSASAEFFCTRWGSAHLPFDRFLDRVQAHGFDGVEMTMPPDRREREAMCAALAARGLRLVCQLSGVADADFAAHLLGYRRALTALCALGPVRINAHTGKDFFSEEQNITLLLAAQDIGARHGVQVVHETHRGRFSYAAHLTRTYLERLPQLELCLDISHWCAVAESMLENQADSVALALRRARHIHARVGNAQAVQLPDPRAPEAQSTLRVFLEWWREVVRANAALGMRTGITSEFGPAPYMPQLPYTARPTCDQWEANVFIMHRLKAYLAMDAGCPALDRSCSIDG